MFDKNDIQILRDMFHENNFILQREMHDLITASEKRIIADVIGRIATSERHVIGEVTEFIGSSILPQIDEHNMRISRLERHTMLIA